APAHDRRRKTRRHWQRDGHRKTEACQARPARASKGCLPAREWAGDLKEPGNPLIGVERFPGARRQGGASVSEALPYSRNSITAAISPPRLPDSVSRRGEGAA